MNLIIKKTSNTPEVVFYSETNEWIITGKSYPKQPSLFYEVVLNWLVVCESMKIKNCIFNFNLEFFNVGSSKVILEILIQLKKLSESCKTKLSIKWFYKEGDETMKEAGEMFMQATEMPLELVSYQN